jgi:hypothetical protein
MLVSEYWIANQIRNKPKIQIANVPNGSSKQCETQGS